MRIEELEDKHLNTINTGIGNTEEELAEYWFSKQKEHTNLSIQFAIEVLEEIVRDNSDLDTVDLTWNKLQKLRQYLDETNSTR